MRSFAKRIDLPRALSAVFIGIGGPAAWVTTCVDRVLRDCALALDSVNCFEKILLGEICAAKLLYCSTRTA